MQTPTTDLNTRPARWTSLRARDRRLADALCPFRGPGGGLQHRLRTGLGLLMLSMLLLGGGLAYATEPEGQKGAGGAPVDAAAVDAALNAPTEALPLAAMRPEATSATPAPFEEWQDVINVTDGEMIVTHGFALAFWPATKSVTLYILLQDRDLLSGCVQSTLVTESGTVNLPLSYFNVQGTIQYYDSCNPRLNYTHPASDHYYWAISTDNPTTLAHLYFANGLAYNVQARQWHPFPDPYLRTFPAARIH